MLFSRRERELREQEEAARKLKEKERLEREAAEAKANAVEAARLQYEAQKKIKEKPRKTSVGAHVEEAVSAPPFLISPSSCTNCRPSETIDSGKLANIRSMFGGGMKRSNTFRKGSSFPHFFYLDVFLSSFIRS